MVRTRGPQHSSSDPPSSNADDRRGRLTVYFTNWGEEPKSNPASIGLENERNVMCFRNCALAILLHIPVFLNWLDAHMESACIRSLQGADCLACHLGHLSREYWKSNESTPEMSALVSRVWGACRDTFWGTYNEREQQDCPEFLSGLLQFLQSGSNGGSPGTQDIDQAQYISHMFQSVVKNRDCCQSCNLVKFRGRDIYSTMVASLSAAGRKDLKIEDCINEYLGAGELSGMRCENCEKETTWDRRIVIRDAPEVLAVQINRFTLQGSGQTMRNLRRVILKEDLDMTEHLESYARKEKHESLNYKLNGVVLHKGPNTKTGHYICYVKGPTGKWSLLDDETVQPVTLNTALGSQTRAFSPYLLFYTRQPLTTPPPKDNPADRSVVKVDDSTMTVTRAPGQKESHSGSGLVTPRRGDDTELLYELGGSEERQDKSLNASFLFGPEAHRSEEGEQKGIVTRWEGQQAKIEIQITMGEMLLTAKLLGVLKKSKQKEAATSPVTSAAKPAGVTKSKGQSKAKSGRKGKK